MLQHIRAAVDMTCMVSFGLRQSSAVHGTKLSCISTMILTGDTCFFVSEDVSSSEVFLKHFPWQLGLFTGRLVSACVDRNSGGQKRKLTQAELDTITQHRQEAMAIRQKKMQGSLYSFHIQNLSVKVLAHAERDICRGGVRRSFPPRTLVILVFRQALYIGLELALHGAGVLVCLGSLSLWCKQQISEGRTVRAGG